MRLLVALVLRERERDCGDGVRAPEGVTLEVPVSEPEMLRLEVSYCVTLAVCVVDPVALGDGDEDCEKVSEVEPDRLIVPLGDGVPLLLDDWDWEAVPESEGVAEIVAVRDAVAVQEGVDVREGDALGEPVVDDVGNWDAEILDEDACEEEPEALLLSV